MTSKKAKIIYILATILVLIALTGRYFYNDAMILATYQSPDGKYELVIKNNRSIFFSTMPGDGGRGSLSVKVILIDADGKVIGTSNDRCSLFFDSIYVDWDYENNWVWYGKGKAIDLKTGEADC